MINSILDSTKKHIGIEPEDNAFDDEITDLINSAIFVLQQAGIGNKGFIVEDSTTEWEDYIPNIDDIPSVKQYIYMSVSIDFDPPSSSFVLEAKKDKRDELLWRLSLDAELTV